MQNFDYNIFGFNALRHQHRLYNILAIAEDRAMPASNPSAAMVAQEHRAVSPLAPPFYDYAGAFKAINPSLEEAAWEPQLTNFFRVDPKYF